jgi:hypothetical protein
MPLCKGKPERGESPVALVGYRPALYNELRTSSLSFLLLSAGA